jgi:hypothetical protein
MILAFLTKVVKFIIILQLFLIGFVFLIYLTTQVLKVQ